MYNWNQHLHTTNYCNANSNNLEKIDIRFTEVVLYVHYCNCIYKPLHEKTTFCKRENKGADKLHS